MVFLAMMFLQLLFSSGYGSSLASSLGYAWENFRVEAEYVWEQQGYRHTPHQGLRRHPLELETLEHSFHGEYDAFTTEFEKPRSHAFYGNVFYDFDSRDWIHNERIFVGVGIGAVNHRLNARMLNIFTRDPHKLLHNIGLPTPPILQPILQRLGIQNYRAPEVAGAVTYLDTTLSDWNIGAKATLGIEIPLNNRLSLVAQGSYGRLLTNFEDSEFDYIVRSHEPTDAPPYLAEAYNDPSLQEPFPIDFSYSKENSDTFSIMGSIRINLGR